MTSIAMSIEKYCMWLKPEADLLFVQFILVQPVFVQPVFVQSISSKPILKELDETPLDEKRLNETGRTSANMTRNSATSPESRVSMDQKFAWITACLVRGNSIYKYISNIYIHLSESDCSYHFPVDLEPNGRPFGSKSIGNW